ncbi:hypothetical protein ANME2D_02998 [Candidatus Methanoperedens nitroreducens]|uniref:DUF5615 domain-containing protein n=1 Tax=Candidatus Methanoperedens nitratireducens TaxID=1392998 RepID=A0A062V5B5_9EURY|nr:DUF5615 family PIN-like protein [Candidatus Methanoperedens nitroreducens]KCZ70969.1 hypothetical protein ANME2D_02998 [Candidatus Methanoperedens nitroreducens]MDJ1421662.1 DUF5615 family PIN-like protein [Candidatus Methanoperedens sp.]
MNFLADENIDRQIADCPRLMGHNVEYVAEKDAGISDDEVLEMANEKTALLEKKEIHDELYLPPVFSRVATDDYYEFNKKFDIGLDYLEGIKTDTGDMKDTLANINTTLEAFVIRQDGHNQRLEKILEKLAER